MARSFSVHAVAAALTLAPCAVGCQDLSDYSTSATKQYVGCVLPADFVLTGVSTATGMCMTLDGDHLEVTPGAITTTDGRFTSTPLRPIPQVWSDPLSTFNFGEGRTKNLLYMVSPAADAGGGADMTAVVSLMSGGDVEVRLLRGAPGGPTGDAGAMAGSVFAVFPLKLRKGGCAMLTPTYCTSEAGVAAAAQE